MVAVRAMRPVFKYGVALCSGLFFGYLTSIILNSGEGFLMGAILVWGVAGYFAAQMILDKTFRVFRKWPGAAAVAAVFVALFLVVGFDLTGYETRIPDPASVERVHGQRPAQRALRRRGVYGRDAGRPNRHCGDRRSPPGGGGAPERGRPVGQHPLHRPLELHPAVHPEKRPHHEPGVHR